MRENARKVISFEGQAVWLYPDGSHRCITRQDAEAINSAVRELEETHYALCFENKYLGSVRYNRNRNALTAVTDREHA